MCERECGQGGRAAAAVAVVVVVVLVVVVFAAAAAGVGGEPHRRETPAGPGASRRRCRRQRGLWGRRQRRRWGRSEVTPKNNNKPALRFPKFFFGWLFYRCLAGPAISLTVSFAFWGRLHDCRRRAGGRGSAARPGQRVHCRLRQGRKGRGGDRGRLVGWGSPVHFLFKPRAQAMLTVSSRALSGPPPLSSPCRSGSLPSPTPSPPLRRRSGHALAGGGGPAGRGGARARLTPGPSRAPEGAAAGASGSRGAKAQPRASGRARPPSPPDGARPLPLLLPAAPEARPWALRVGRAGPDLPRVAPGPRRERREGPFAPPALAGAHLGQEASRPPGGSAFYGRLRHHPRPSSVAARGL